MIAGNSSVAVLGHLVEAVHAGRGLLGDALDALADLRPALRVLARASASAARGSPGTPRSPRRPGRAPRRRPRTRCPCGRAASRRRRRRGSCSGPTRRRSVLPGQRRACSVHHQYSSSVSPFHAKTRARPRGSSGVPSGPTATAAAAWSWVEKMLQEHQRTSAPSAVSVSISTAVWIVMCSEPVMRAPVQRLRGGELLADRHQAGHLVLGEADLLAAELGEREVGDLEVGVGERGGGCHAASMVRWVSGSGRRAGAATCEQPLVLLLLEAQPVGGRDVLGPGRLGRRASPRPRRAAPARGASAAAKPISASPTSKRSSSSRRVRSRCSWAGP